MKEKKSKEKKELLKAKQELDRLLYIHRSNLRKVYAIIETEDEKIIYLNNVNQ